MNGWMAGWIDGLMEERLEDKCKYSNMDRNMKKVRLDDRCDSFTQSSGFAMFLVTQAPKEMEDRYKTRTHTKLQPKIQQGSLSVCITSVHSPLLPESGTVCCVSLLGFTRVLLGLTWCCTISWEGILSGGA